MPRVTPRYDTCISQYGLIQFSESDPPSVKEEIAGLCPLAGPVILKSAMLIAAVAPTYSDEIFLQYYHGLTSAQKHLRAKGVDIDICLIDNNDLPAGVNCLGDGAELLRIAARDEFAGIVTLGGILSFLDDGTLPYFLSDTYAGKPVINVMCKLPGIPSITTGNAHGINLLVDHLVQVHGYRRIAMINGIPGHPDAVARYAAYVARLEHHGLVCDPAWVADGMYSVASGQEIADQWILAHNRGASLPEAVVAANDDMAYGFIRRFGKYRAETQDAVTMPAVCGFDNRDFCMSITPTITTVAQPVYLMASTALEYFVDHIENGTELPAHTTVPPELVVRRSCGCVGAPRTTGSSTAEISQRSGHYRELFRRCQESIRQFLTDLTEKSTADTLFHRLQPLIKRLSSRWAPKTSTESSPRYRMGSRPSSSTPQERRTLPRVGFSATSRTASSRESE
jgi:DNA-binding LacI/PurR family transcriptional regulator